MNKSQKWVVKIAFVSVLTPPFNQYKTVITGNNITKIRTGTGWNFVWKINRTLTDRLSAAVVGIEYYKIRFDILILEWIGIIALGGFFFLLYKKS